jgi:hypothetical protein
MQKVHACRKNVAKLGRGLNGFPGFMPFMSLYIPNSFKFIYYL